MEDKDLNITKEETKSTIAHPLENVLDIESNTTIVPRTQQTTELSTIEQYDDKDDEIDHQMQSIYDKAIDGYEAQMDAAELVEGKYKARNSEVAVQFLNTALSAAREKSGMKQHKDKMMIAQNKINGSGTTNNNLVIADRNDILKMMNREKEE